MTPTSARPARKIETSLPDRDFVFVINNASDFRHPYAAAGIMLCSSSCSQRWTAICRLSCFARRLGMIGADRPGARGAAGVDNLMLGRPPESLVQGQLWLGHHHPSRSATV